MKIGVISDLHLYRKTVNISRALQKLQDMELLLIVGDIADRAEAQQYEILTELLEDYPACVYCVSGNHDNPDGDDTAYRLFEKRISPAVPDESGAFRCSLDETTELIGLNPMYHQKQFRFPEKGRQLKFLEECLRTGGCTRHIVLCHPPLLAHNPQRKAGMPPYFPPEQDERLQQIIDASEGVIFLSGHTHLPPDTEYDSLRRNLYINDGSICPTGSKETGIQQGNVTILDLKPDSVSVTICGIHTDRVFLEETFPMQPEIPGEFHRIL